jgi:hypothetical protein
MENIKLYFRIILKMPSAIIILIVGLFLLYKKHKSNEINLMDLDIEQLKEKMKEFVLIFHPYDIHFNFIFWGTLLFILTK